MKIEDINNAIEYFEIYTTIHDDLDKQKNHHIVLEVLREEAIRLEDLSKRTYLGNHAGREVYSCDNCGSTTFIFDNYCPDCGYPVVNKPLTIDELKENILKPVWIDYTGKWDILLNVSFENDKYLIEFDMQGFYFDDTSSGVNFYKYALIDNPNTNKDTVLPIYHLYPCQQKLQRRWDCDFDDIGVTCSCALFPDIGFWDQNYLSNDKIIKTCREKCPLLKNKEEK